MNQNNFGLLWQWTVAGNVYAQPLAITYPQTIGSCNNPCSLVIIATEQDMLYIQRGLQFIHASLGTCQPRPGGEYE